MPNLHRHYKSKSLTYSNCGFIVLYVYIFFAFNTRSRQADKLAFQTHFWILRKQIALVVCVCWVCVCDFSVRVGKRHSSQDSVTPPSHSNRCWSHGGPWQEVSAALHQTHWSAHQPDGWMNDTSEKGVLSSGLTRSGWVTGCRRENRLPLNLKKLFFLPFSTLFSPFSLFQGADSPPNPSRSSLFSVVAFCFDWLRVCVCLCVCGGQCRVWGVLNALLSEAECVSQLTGPVLFGAVNSSGRGRGKTGGVKREREKSEGKRRGTCGCRERDSWEAYRRAWPHLKSKGSLAGHSQLFHKAEMNYWILSPQQNNSYS